MQKTVHALKVCLGRMRGNEVGDRTGRVAPQPWRKYPELIPTAGDLRPAEAGNVGVGGRREVGPSQPPLGPWPL